MKLGITLDFEGSNVKEARILYKAFGKEICIKYGFNYSRLLEMMVKKLRMFFRSVLIKFEIIENLGIIGEGAKG